MSTDTPHRWWITTDALARGGEKILGPFATQELALNVRTYVEKVERQRMDKLWVDEEEVPETAPAWHADWDLVDRDSDGNAILKHLPTEGLYKVLPVEEASP